MAGEPVIVAAQYLLDRQGAWNEGYDLHGPEAIAAGLPPAVRDAAEVVVCGGSLDMALVDMLPALKLVACFPTGIEGVDVAALAARGIAVTNAAGVNAHDVADHAMALFLARWHSVPAADRAVRQAGGWGAFRQETGARPSLRGRHAGVLGLGRIGSDIAARAAAHGMEVRWWGPRAKPDAPYERCASLQALAGWADVLFVAGRAGSDNAGQVDAAVLAALGARGMLVNISRGLLVDEPALRAALADGTLGGAALDVFVEEPTDPAAWGPLGDEVVLTPHLGGFTQEAGRDMFGQLRENLRRHFAGEPLLTPVS